MSNRHWLPDGCLETSDPLQALDWWKKPVTAISLKYRLKKFSSRPLLSDSNLHCLHVNENRQGTVLPSLLARHVVRNSNQESRAWKWTEHLNTIISYRKRESLELPAFRGYGVGVAPSASHPQLQQSILPQQSPNSENLKQITEGAHTAASPEQDRASATAHPLLQNPPESGGVRRTGCL